MLSTFLGYSFGTNESLIINNYSNIVRISEILKLTTTGHCFPKVNKCRHPNALQMQKRGTG